MDTTTGLLPADVIVSLRIAPSELTLRQQVKQGGGRWDPRRQVWEMRYAQAVALGMTKRILQPTFIRLIEIAINMLLCVETEKDADMEICFYWCQHVAINRDMVDA